MKIPLAWVTFTPLIRIVGAWGEAITAGTVDAGRVHEGMRLLARRSRIQCRAAFRVILVLFRPGFDQRAEVFLEMRLQRGIIFVFIGAQGFMQLRAVAVEHRAKGNMENLARIKLVE